MLNDRGKEIGKGKGNFKGNVPFPLPFFFPRVVQPFPVPTPLFPR